MPNYKNGKIYKIVCNTTGKIYIGSTTVLLCRRLAGHVLDNKRGKTTSCKEILDGGNFSIVLIENLECDTKEQLLKRERYYIDSIECVNKYRPIVSVEEKKEKMIGIHKNWYKNNKETILDKAKEYQQINKDKIAERKKIYRNNNKDKIVEKAKEYYELNKENIIQQKKEYRLKRKQEKQKQIEQAIEELHIAVERVPL